MNERDEDNYVADVLFDMFEVQGKVSRRRWRRRMAPPREPRWTPQRADRLQRRRQRWEQLLEGDFPKLQSLSMTEARLWLELGIPLSTLPTPAEEDTRSARRWWDNLSDFLATEEVDLDDRLGELCGYDACSGEFSEPRPVPENHNYEFTMFEALYLKWSYIHALSLLLHQAHDQVKAMVSFHAPAGAYHCRALAVVEVEAERYIRERLPYDRLTWKSEARNKYLDRLWRA